MQIIAIERPCAFRVIRQAQRPSARNPEPGWISQCQHPRCPGHWRTGLATEAIAIDAYAEHECDDRHKALHPGCFVQACLGDNSRARIDMYRGNSPRIKEDEMTEQATTTETTQPEQATDTKPAKPKKAKKAGALVDCFCRTFEVGEDIGTDENPDVTIETTGCSQSTNRTFAQGHDAKLVSFLVAAELAGKDIRYGRNTGMVTTTDAVGACRLVSQELAHKAKVALANGTKRRAAKTERAAAKAAAKANKGAERAMALQKKLDAKAKGQAEQTTNNATVGDAIDAEATITNIPLAKVAGKVGRWEYKGTVGEDGSFTFINGGGHEQTVPADKWQPLDS